MKTKWWNFWLWPVVSILQPIPGKWVRRLACALLVMGTGQAELSAQTATETKEAGTVPAASKRESIASKAMVATVHPEATKAALQVLRSGGNAVDAAVAAGLMLGVVDSHNSGIGGGCFILIRTPEGKVIAIDGREMAPAAATRDMYVVDGELRPELSQAGPLAVAVPGAIAAYDLALRGYGTKPLKDLALPAATIAENGFELDTEFARSLKGSATDLARFEGPKAIFFHADGSVFQQGELLKQPHLAQTYRMLASEGADWFYKGRFAKRIGRWMERNGGILTADDFAKYRAVQREPLTTTYRDYQVVGFPPPSSGGILIAQLLGMLEEFNIAQMHQDDPATAAHVMIEAMKLAFADRAHWLGDADFVAIPRGLIAKPYLKELAARIKTDRMTPVEGHGNPPNAGLDQFSNRHTTHLCVVDEKGYWVGITATINTTFGSKVIVPGTGVFLNNEMDDFSIQPGVPNAFGLVGAENNSIAPGKRPLSSMSPTLVIKDNEPVMMVGAAGGPKIVTSVLLTMIRYLDFGMPLSDAVGAPRFHHQWRPDQVTVEDRLPDELAAVLEAKGHKLRRIHEGGVCQAIARLPDGKLVGVSDPRVPGRAGGL